MAWPNCTLVLLPGLDGTGDLFKPFLDQFPADAKIKVVSYPRERILDFDQLADIARSQIPTSGNVVVLAESFSGPVAARLLSDAHIIGVILCASFLRSPRPAVLSALRYFPLSSFFRVRVPAFLLRFACLGKDCPVSTVELARVAIGQILPQVMESRFRLLAKIDDLSRISGFDRPILYLRPSDDRLVPPRCSIEIQEAHGSVRIHDVKGPHFLLQSSPQEAYSIVRGFCDELCVAT